MQLHSISKKITEDWERIETENATPYYINHKSKKTQWDHPLFVKSMEELGEYDDIKYAAYRTAMKIRHLQGKLALEGIELKHVTSAFSSAGCEQTRERMMDCCEARRVVRALCEGVRRPLLEKVQPQLCADMLLNLLLNMFDINRSGCMRLTAVKVCLATLSSARLSEKYKYYFEQASDDTNHLDRKRMRQLLHDLMQLPHMLNESQSFGGMNVNAAVESCFAQSWGSAPGITEDEWIRWLLQEPQTTVWLPTMHRLAAGDQVEHDGKCSVCKMCPIRGLRYKCLKCFNYDLCQNCFFTGKTNKKHKVKHPTQEYCFNTSTKEDTKAFMRTVRNNFSKKHRNKRKPRYLPIHSSQQPSTPGLTPRAPPFIQAEQDDSSEAKRRDRSRDCSPPLSVSIEQEVMMKRASTPSSVQGFSVSERRELASIIQHLEHENMYLMEQLEGAYQHRRNDSPHSSESRDSVVSESDDSDWTEREKMDARQEVLETHNTELNKQLARLRTLLHKNNKDGESHISHRRPLSPLSINTTKHSHEYSNQHSTSYAKPHHSNHPSNAPSYHHHQSQPSGSLHGDSFYIDGHSLVGSQPEPPIVPRLQLSKLMDTEQFCATPLNMHAKGAPPKPQFVTPESYGVEVTPGMNGTGAILQKSHYQTQTPDSVELTFGCIDNSMGRTHYSIATPEDSRDFAREEREMAELVARLDQQMLAEGDTGEAASESRGAVGEMLRAAAGIGEAFAHMTTHRQPPNEHGDLEAEDLNTSSV